MFASPCSPASSLSPRPFGSGAFRMRQRINIREHFWRGNAPITKIVVAQQSAPRRLRHCRNDGATRSRDYPMWMLPTALVCQSAAMNSPKSMRCLGMLWARPDLIALAGIDTIRNWGGCSGKAQAEPAGLS